MRETDAERTRHGRRRVAQALDARTALLGRPAARLEVQLCDEQWLRHEAERQLVERRNVRRNSPAATTRTSDTAIWRDDERTAHGKAAVARNAAARVLERVAGVTLFSPITGATPAVIAERHARAAVNASTRQSSARSSDTVLCHVLNCCTRSALLHFANTSPNAAPVTATIRLSTKSSRAIRRASPSASAR